MSEQDNTKKHDHDTAGTEKVKPYIDPSLLNVSPSLRKVQPSLRKVSSDDPNLENIDAASEDSDRLQAELAETKDKLLRALADVENMRRRTEKDVKDASVYAVAKFANDMLSVGDNLRRALDSAPPEIRTDKVAASLLEGVEITERTLLQTLERYNVKPIAALDAKFDPNFHQAMFEVMNPTEPPGTIMHVIQTGYTIGDRMLRPALVGVAKAKQS
ncbi:MAG: nucleotide exchange factor GrpE [Pseudomonadota bacterium]